jgi:hypothetical protein
MPLTGQSAKTLAGPSRIVKGEYSDSRMLANLKMARVADPPARPAQSWEPTPASD